MDWRALLDRQRIPYIERGANVKRGEINIRCPWCGTADPSHHLGLNLESGWYSCWRNRQGHSGKSPLRLLMKLLRVGYEEARELAGLGESYIDPEGFTAMAARLMGREIAASPAKAQPSLVYPAEFRQIDDTGRTRRWYDYLHGRGFDRLDVVDVCDYYDLQAAVDGDFAGRLIFPYTIDLKLVAWTGRAIGAARIRYKDLGIDQSVVPIKHLLYNSDLAELGGKALAIVEGPVDTIKVDYYGRHWGVRAVGLSTNSISADQVYRLEELAGHFDRVIFLMDNKSGFGAVDSMRMKQNLAFLPKAEVMSVPFNQPDPGELTPREVKQWAKEITR